MMKHYYGEFGKQFRSNSDISTLLTNPLSLGTQPKNLILIFSWWLFSYSNTRAR